MRDGLTDHWREILRFSTGQVNEGYGVGIVIDRIPPRHHLEVSTLMV
jgi:hypothetical protein